MGRNSLNSEQSRRLQDLFGTQAGAALDDVDLFRTREALNAVYQEQFDCARASLAQADSFLTPEQAAAVAAANSNYWNEVKTKMTLYQQLVESTIQRSRRE